MTTCVCGHDGLPEQWHADHCLRNERDTPADVHSGPGNARGSELRAQMIAALPGAHPWGEIVDHLLAGPLADLMAQRDEARVQARTAWDVHAEHVDRMNVLLLQAQAERDEAQAKVARVEALADEVDAEAEARGIRLDRCIPPGDRIRAALGGDS